MVASYSDARSCRPWSALLKSAVGFVRHGEQCAINDGAAPASYPADGSARDGRRADHNDTGAVGKG